MRTTVTLDDELLNQAADYAGINERSVILRMALEEFVQRRAELRMAKLKGSVPDFGKKQPRRQRPLPE